MGVYIGGIIGEISNDTNIENCYNEGNISSSENVKYADIGGIVGYSIDNSNILKSYNTGNIVVKKATSSILIGGIIGPAGDNSRIDECYNTGNLTVENSSGYIVIGGITSQFDGTINKCHNTGNISGINILNSGDYKMLGGIVASGYSATIQKSYNTGKIYVTGSAPNYIGGIAGSAQSVDECYNVGDIEIKITNVLSFMHSGGILGSGSVSNSYNMGNIINYANNYTTEESSNTIYVAGIVGSNGSRVFNNYNIGNINNIVIPPESVQLSIKTTPIGNEASDIKNNYYLNNIELIGENNLDAIEATPLSEEYMKSKEFYNELSKSAGDGNSWKYINKQYPVLDIATVSNAQKITEITVENSKKKFDITTEIAENISGSRSGGTITGDYTEKYIPVNNRKYIETLLYGANSTKEIIMTPSEGYKVSEVKVNGKLIDIYPDTDGIVKLPVGYFKNASENYNILVTFTEQENIFTINKVDESGNALQGAEFEISQVDERPEIANEMGEIVGNSEVYTSINKENNANDSLGELTNNGEYYFVKQDDGTYISNNGNVANSSAKSYVKIDLTNKTGNYKVIVNAKVISKGYYDRGTAKITQSSDASSYGTAFMNTYTGSSNTDYISNKLEGGKVYYLHLAFGKNTPVDTGNDGVTINSINIYETVDEKYDFSKVDNKYISSNQGKGKTYSMSYIPIDLTNSQGKYDVTVNAEISSQNGEDYGYAFISENTARNTSHSYANGKFIHLAGTVEAKDYKTTLEGGKKYYLHMVYYNGAVDTDNGTDTFTINNVNLSLNKDDYYYEEKAVTDTEGKIIRGLKFGKYEIKETKAPEGYSNDDNVITHIIGTGTNNNITVTNKALKDVIVHYYENGTGAEFNKDPVTVSEDVVLYGKIGEWYESEVHTEIGEYNLVTDNNGEYVIPDNASGKYENDQINVYYYYEKNVNFGYKIEHYYQNKETGNYDLKYTDSKELTEQAIVTITEDDYRLETGYEFERQEGSPMAVRDNSENNVIRIYYKIADFDYTVHYFYDGIEDTSLTETLSAKFGDKITTYTDKVKEGYMLGSVEPLNENGNLELIITNDESKNKLNIYYVKQYEITTGVVIHTETHKNGSVDENIKGGTISGEGVIPYERVAPGGSNELLVEIVPDEGYQIVKITINNKTLDFAEKLSETGTVTLEKGYFTDVRENKHIEVEFRKIATVVTKYLDKDTNEPISEEVVDKGYENKAFSTEKRTIRKYVFDSVTDENGNEVITSGNMPVEGLTVIYWYKKVETGVVEKHIEIKEDGTLETLETKTSKGEDGLSINVLRKQLPGYEATNGPESTDENVFVMTKDEDSKTITYEEGKVFEVLYYYKKKKLNVTVKYMDNITGKEIKKAEILTGTLNEPYSVERKSIPGYKLDITRLPNNETGTFTEDETTVEYYYIELRTYSLKVIYKANNEIMDGAKIKVEKGTEMLKDDYTINGVLEIEKLELTDLLSQTYTIYETETPEYCTTVVSKEKPGIVEITGTFNETERKYEFVTNCNDIEGLSTEVDEANKVINIYIESVKSEKYNLAIKKFISAIDDEKIEDRAPKTEISEDGKVTYKLNDRIEKASNNQSIKYTIRMYNESDVNAKGKRIVEYIPDGLVYVPNNDINKQYGWVMYGADKNGQVYKTENPEEAVIVVSDYLVNKKIDARKGNDLSYLYTEVVFKVDESKLKTDDRIIENKVIIMPNENDDYPDNDESVEKLYVKYFDLNIEKYIEQVKIKNKNGETIQKVGEDKKNQLLKIDVKRSEVNSTTITVTYGLRVKNIGEIPGYATKVIDYIPENFKLVEDGIWSQDGNIAVSTSLEDKLLNPGESTVVNVTFEWNLSEGTVGSRVNEAKIATYTNKYNAIDLTEDNNDKEELLVAIKTGSEKAMCITIVLGFITIVGIGTIFSKKIIKK